jgi:uncharacterized protein (TIGR03067 family)
MHAMMLLILAAGPGADEAAPKDLDAIQGTWETTAVHYDGRDLAADGLKLKLTFKGKEVSVDGDDEVKKDYGKFTVKLDPSTKPKCIDIVVVAGEQKDSVIEGIYELKGDELRLCARVVGKERPDKFASPEGQNIALVVLKRVKP